MDQTTTSLECPSCGARRDTAADSANCAFCGTPLPYAAPRRAAPSPSDVRSERLRRVRESREFAELRSHAPSVSEFRNGFIALGAFGAVFAGFACCFIAVGLGGMRSAGFMILPFLLIPGIFVLVGGGLVVNAVRSVRRLADAPLRMSPAIVTGKREHRGGKHGRVVTWYVTIETDDGRRSELKTTGRAYGSAAADDAGIAWTKDEYLLEFRRIDA